MSHTTEITDIVFTDVVALQLAVTELASKGIRCTLIKGGAPRAYYANQAGMEKAEYVLQLQDSPYDVGFYQDKKLKGMVARTDLFAGKVAKVLGVPVQGDETAGQAALGKLNQTYAIHAAMRKAAQQGMTVQRINKADGSVRLVLGGVR